jgi:hypothetical protein
MSPLSLVQQHVPGSTSRTSNFPKQKKLSILGYTWHKHIFAKRKHLGITLSKTYWLLGRKSSLSISNKLLAYKVILKHHTRLETHENPLLKTLLVRKKKQTT